MANGFLSLNILAKHYIDVLQGSDYISVFARKHRAKDFSFIPNMVYINKKKKKKRNRSLWNAVFERFHFIFKIIIWSKLLYVR